jgi:aspartyl protease family protein
VTSRKQIDEQRRMGLTMHILAWMVLIGLGVMFFGDVLERQYNPNRNLVTREEADLREVVLQRNRFGHYVTGGQINGQPVTFLLDTGATGVAIPPRVAQRLALQRGRPIATRTANGVATSYATALDTVSVGDIELAGVGATIAPGLAGDEVLLGMSFLKQIEFTQRGDTLILRQHL